MCPMIPRPTAPKAHAKLRVHFSSRPALIDPAAEPLLTATQRQHRTQENVIQRAPDLTKHINRCSILREEVFREEARILVISGLGPFGSLTNGFEILPSSDVATTRGSNYHQKDPFFVVASRWMLPHAWISTLLRKARVIYPAAVVVFPKQARRFPDLTRRFRGRSIARWP